MECLVENFGEVMWVVVDQFGIGSGLNVVNWVGCMIVEGVEVEVCDVVVVVCCFDDVVFVVW